MECDLYESERIEQMEKIEHIYLQHEVPIPSHIIDLQSLLGGIPDHWKLAQGEILSAVGDYMLATRCSV